MQEVIGTAIAFYILSDGKWVNIWLKVKINGFFFSAMLYNTYPHNIRGPNCVHKLNQGCL